MRAIHKLLSLCGLCSLLLNLILAIREMSSPYEIALTGDTLPPANGPHGISYFRTYSCVSDELYPVASRKSRSSVVRG